MKAIPGRLSIGSVIIRGASRVCSRVCNYQILTYFLPLIVFIRQLLPQGYSIIWAEEVCAAPKGMVFQPFWSEIGYGLYTLVLNWRRIMQPAL